MATANRRDPVAGTDWMTAGASLPAPLGDALDAREITAALGHLALVGAIADPVTAAVSCAAVAGAWAYGGRGALERIGARRSATRLARAELERRRAVVDAWAYVADRVAGTVADGEPDTRPLRWAIHLHWEHRAAGSSRAQLVAPRGETVGPVLAHIERFRSGMRDHGVLDIVTTDGLSHRATVVVAPKTPDATRKVHRWRPAAEVGEWGLGSVPLGVDRLGQSITVSLDGSSGGSAHALVGGSTGSGKTSAMVTLLAGVAEVVAVSDELVTVIVLDGKGGRDLRPWIEWASVGVSGDHTRILQALEAVVAEQRRRYDEADFDAPAVVVVVDEVSALTGSNGQHRTETLAALAEIAERGREARIVLALGIQSPRAKTLPVESLRDQIGSRVLLKAEGQEMRRSVMGDRPLPVDPVGGLPPLPGLGVVVSATTPKATVTRVLHVRKAAEREVMRRTAGRMSRPAWIDSGGESVEEGEDMNTATATVVDDEAAGEGPRHGVEAPAQVIRLNTHLHARESDDTGGATEGGYAPSDQGLWASATVAATSATPVGNPVESVGNPHGNPSEWTYSNGVAEVRRLLDGPMSLTEIADHLNAGGYPTKSGRGSWSKGSVSKLRSSLDAHPSMTDDDAAPLPRRAPDVVDLESVAEPSAEIRAAIVERVGEWSGPVPLAEVVPIRGGAS